jgi:hypothetical protein
MTKTLKPRSELHIVQNLAYKHYNIDVNKSKESSIESGVNNDMWIIGLDDKFTICVKTLSNIRPENLKLYTKIGAYIKATGKSIYYSRILFYPELLSNYQTN